MAFEWEVTLMEFLQGHMGTSGEKIAAFFTSLGEETVLVLLFGLIYWCLDKKAGKTIGTGLLIALIVNPAIKNLIHRRRPYFDHKGIKCLKPVNGDADIYDISAQGYSFPSAHSMDSAVACWSAYRIWKNRIFRIIMIVVPFLIGLSRIVLGNHYPTDVMTGWFLGLIIVTLVPLISSRFENENIFRLILFILSLMCIPFCHTDDFYTGLGMMAGFFLAIPFEERFVSFKETRHPVSCVIRVAVGMGMELGLNALLKLPFSKSFLENGSMGAHLVRTGRYAIIIFIIFAIYPMIFRKVKAFSLS